MWNELEVQGMLAADSTTIAVVAAVVALAVVVAFILRKRVDSRPAAGREEETAPAPVSEDAGQEAPPQVAPVSAETTLQDGLKKTRSEGFIARLGKLFSSPDTSLKNLDEVEEVLFTADIGVKTAHRLIAALKEALGEDGLADTQAVWSVLRREAITILQGAAAKTSDVTGPPASPHITMVLGVNGAGKTTSIGKLGHQLVEDGQKVAFIAGDTFRAAAAEQLEVWGQRVGAEVTKGKEGADPASVVFDGVKQAVEDGAEHVFVDTAGRLHTHTNLMAELAKIRRVMGKAVEGAPHEVLMVLDATTGQNAIQQAKMFDEATDVTGIVLTKLDGTAKGGIVIGVCDELKIPIRYIGIGEKVADLRRFDPERFVDALFGDAA